MIEPAYSVKLEDARGQSLEILAVKIHLARRTRDLLLYVRQRTRIKMRNANHLHHLATTGGRRLLRARNVCRPPLQLDERLALGGLKT